MSFVEKTGGTSVVTGVTAVGTFGGTAVFTTVGTVAAGSKTDF